MAETVQVELVAVDGALWSGEAEMVVARTVDGEIGVLAGHAPLLGALAPGVVRILQGRDGGEVRAAVHGGFLSVSDDGVQVLAAVAELGEAVDTGRARSALERARAAGDDDPEAVAAARRAEARLRAAGEDA